MFMFELYHRFNKAAVWCCVILAAVAILAVALSRPDPFNSEASRADDRAIFDDGFAVAAAGGPPQACPYAEGFFGRERSRMIWMKGYSEALVRKAAKGQPR